MSRTRRGLQIVTAGAVVLAWAVLYVVVVTTAPLSYDPATESAAKVNREFALLLTVPTALWVTAALLLVNHWWSRTGIRMFAMDPPGRLLAAAVATLPHHRRQWFWFGPVAVFSVPAFATGWVGRSFRSGLRAGIWAGIASLPLTYALWLHEALRLYAIDGGLLWFGDGAPEGENLGAGLFWALRFAPLLGVPFAVIGAAIGAHAARPPAAQAQHAAATIKP